MAKSKHIAAVIVIFMAFFFSTYAFAFPKKAKDFTLLSPEGRLSLSQLKGQVVLIFFGFTACPDVCPISLSTISNVFHHLKAEELEKSKALFITLDPERDMVEMMVFLDENPAIWLGESFTRLHDMEHRQALPASGPQVLTRPGPVPGTQPSTAPLG